MTRIEGREERRPRWRFGLTLIRAIRVIRGSTLLEGAMHWLFTAARRLRELGILGMNRRNAACILDHNPRAKFPIVDDKMKMHRLCRDIGVPTPEVYAEVTSYSMLRRLPELLGNRADFVIKPN